MRKAIIGIVVGMLGILLVLLSYGIANSGPTGATESTALRLGRPAPDFSIRLFAGGTFSLAQQRGKVVVVNFWASWCPPCRKEAPVLEQAWRAYKDRGVVLVGINIWDSESDARSFLREFDITYPNGPDPRGEIAIEYGVTAIPETWFINREGRLWRRWIGALTDYRIAALIEEALR